MNLSKVCLAILFFSLNITSVMANGQAEYMASQFASIHMCVPGVYFDGNTAIKRTNTACIVKYKKPTGQSKICRFPLGFYKEMMDDNLRLNNSDYERKYSNSEATYCK